MKHGYLIFNPSAGMRAKSRTVVAGVIREFAKYDLDITPSPTEPEGSTVRQVQELVREEPDLLVSWGGDGTINEVINGMFGSGIPLGVIPGGTANVFAKELGISGLNRAIAIIGKGKTKTISIGEANKRYFSLMAGVGFDSDVIKNVDWTLKKTLGKLAFGISALNSAVKYDFPKFQVKIGNEKKECVFAVISNARGYGGVLELTPEADISDEYFHVCLFKEAGFNNVLRYAMHAWKNSHGKLKDVEILKVKRCEVIGPESVAVQADGELIGFLPMKFKLHPHALEVFCP